MIATFFRRWASVVVIALSVFVAGCATARYEDSGVEVGTRRSSSSSGRSVGIGVGMGVLGVGASTLFGGGSQSQEKKPEEKKEQTPEEAEKAKSP